MTFRQSEAGPTAIGDQRLPALLAAQHVITSDVGLEPMLHRIVTTACDLAGARYGALGVVAPDGTIEHFVHHGMDAGTVARIGHLPRGRGLLGAVLNDAAPVRLADLAADPRSAGFPAAHPPMRSFLGVPIRVRGAAFGELYLADPAVGRFAAEDEGLVLALAATAGAAIENARLSDAARRSESWLNASGEISRVLLAGDDDEDVLRDVVARALGAAEADYAALILPAADGRLQVTMCKGDGAGAFLGHTFDPVGSPLGRAILAGQSLHTPDLRLWSSDDFDNVWDYGPAMLAPLSDSLGTRGAVLVIRRRGRAPFASQDVDLAATFAAQVAVALQLNDARDDAEWLRVLEERHRIARDLHDNVIQRLFATGVRLQVLVEQPISDELSGPLRGVISDLDETIDQIRTRVFGLRSASAPGRGSRVRFPPVAVREAGGLVPGAATAHDGIT